MQGRAHKGRVQPLVQQCIHEFTRARLLQRHGHAGHLLAEHAQHAGDKGMQRGRAGEAHGQPARLAPGGTAHHLGQHVTALQQRLGLFQQRQPRRRGPHAARQALHQLHAQFVLQALQQPRQRRLLHAQALGRAGDVAFLGDGDKGAQLAKLGHINTFKVWEDFNCGICNHGWTDLRSRPTNTPT